MILVLLDPHVVHCIERDCMNQVKEVINSTHTFTSHSILRSERYDIHPCCSVGVSDVVPLLYLPHTIIDQRTMIYPLDEGEEGARSPCPDQRTLINDPSTS